MRALGYGAEEQNLSEHRSEDERTEPQTLSKQVPLLQIFNIECHSLSLCLSLSIYRSMKTKQLRILHTYCFRNSHNYPIIEASKTQAITIEGSKSVIKEEKKKKAHSYRDVEG